jgi:hypothetical protein
VGNKTPSEKKGLNCLLVSHPRSHTSMGSIATIALPFLRPPSYGCFGEPHIIYASPQHWEATSEIRFIKDHFTEPQRGYLGLARQTTGQ